MRYVRLVVIYSQPSVDVAGAFMTLCSPGGLQGVCLILSSLGGAERAAVCRR